MVNQNNSQLTAQKIRNRYAEKQPTELEALKDLDARVTHPANVFSYIFGSISAIIMGCGMSLVMTDIASTVGMSSDPMIPGVFIGIVGLALALLNYPLHKAILNFRKKKYASQIITLSDKIISTNE